MSASRWSVFWKRTGQAFRESTRQIINMEGAELPNRGPRLLYSFNTIEATSEAVLGCDGDIGGRSTVNFVLDTTSEDERVGRPTAKFHGHLRLDVRPDLVGRINSGYAGFKTPVRSTLFGKIRDNVYFHDYLALRVRAAGNPVLHNSYFVNIQTIDQMSQATVWQHPLRFRRQDNDWETVYLPFTEFQPFTIGEPNEFREYIDKENILTVGVACLGGRHNASGPYELGLDSIWAVNEDDLEEDSPGPNRPPEKTPPEKRPILEKTP
ncbi:complex I intermediate-associated protein CIA30 [Mycena rosella]|uniref:Complex I intermediate-associated protein CIA30 n=1 Tax=Mycena rosella TaxID=1033263 RepID=A0AAD7D7X8_MYCRO|nr:complex I intermediate-associated protein CIA30 [Mycena rosella]